MEADTSSAPAKRRRLPVLVIVPVAVVLFGGFGYFMSRRPLDAPDQLAGLRKSTDAAMVADAERSQVAAKDGLGGSSTIAQYYGGPGNALLLIAGREKLNLDRQWTSLEKDAGRSIPHRKVNGVECSSDGEGMVVCIWSDDVSGLFFDYRAGSTVEQAAAAAREAKDALN